MWHSPHPLAARIDPDASRPSLIGSTWRRRAPEGDAWDRVRIAGIFDCGPDGGGLELVVQTVDFTGEPTLTADASSFADAYARDDNSGVTESLQQALRVLEARAR
jgi:hypothetical protein